MNSTKHRWKFVRTGGIDQVTIRNGADIAALHSLDQKLWVALACPVQGLELDPKTLSLIDTDNDGRIRVPEVLATITWLTDALSDLDILMKGGEELPVSSINDKTSLGTDLLVAARRVLEEQGQTKGGASQVKLADVTTAVQQFSAHRFNGDGVLVADAADSSESTKVIEEIIATHGSIPDRSGKMGIDQARLDAFFTEAQQLIDWNRKSEHSKAILPLGAETPAAATLVSELKPKIDDYFTRCRLASFDGRAVAALNGTDAEYVALGTKDLTTSTQEIAKLPLARIEGGRALPFTDGVNPAWAAKLSQLASTLEALLGRPIARLTESEWDTAQTKLAAYQTWCAEKPVTKVELLGLPRLLDISQSGSREALTELIKKDLAAEGDYNQLASLLRLLHLQRDFVKLLNNFVNFSEFYNRSGAIFQSGSLYLDRRRCDLCVTVADAGKQAALASLAKCYLTYCDCVRPNGERMSIVAAYTGGDSDHLMVGRNGVFYDRHGRDWDATITKIIENPISIRQAFWAPYKNFLRLVEEQVTKRAAAAEAESNTKLKDTAAQTAAADQTKPADGKAPPKKSIDIGTVAAIGVAVGGIATFFTSILALFFGLGPWMPLGFLALMLSISLPSMLIAWLKLRQRSLGPILDANGWAVNGLVRINVPFGGALTSVASIPLGSERSLRDPYLEKKHPSALYMILVTLVGLAGLWYLGKMDQFLPGHLSSTSVLGERAPAKADKAPPSEKK